MRITAPRLSNIQKMLDFYSQFNPSPLSIKQFIDFGNETNTEKMNKAGVGIGPLNDVGQDQGLNACERKSFKFLRKELPVRLANIMKEIALLPENLLRTPSVGMVSNWYAQSFEEVLKYEKSDPFDDTTVQKFCRDLITIRDRHSDVVQTMARGIIELKEYRSDNIDPSTELSIQYFLDRLYMSRISIRMLINQHTMLFGEPPKGRHIGCIDPMCDPAAVVQDAFHNAKFLCDQYYEGSPELSLNVFNQNDKEGPIRIVYVPSHLYHMLFEIFKNSMRAVMEHFGSNVDSTKIPPIQVTVVKGKEDICVKVSDLGGGIARSQSDQLFKYMYSTAPTPFQQDLDTLTVPLAGYGYGLPISRLYARYFHGDLVLMSCDGYGTDAIIYLKALSDEANELLPIFNKTSSKFYKATVATGDWSNQSLIMNARQINSAQPKRITPIGEVSSRNDATIEQKPIATSN